MEFVLCFSHGKTRVVGFGKEDNKDKMSFLLHHIEYIAVIVVV